MIGQSATIRLGSTVLGGVRFELTSTSSAVAGEMAILFW
jgi:hypothetical protein